MKIYGYIFCLSVLLFSACTDAKALMRYPELAGGVEDLEKSEFSDSDRAARTARLQALLDESYPEYRIDAGDVLAIKVYNHPDLDITTTVTPDGHISLMLVGKQKMAGETIESATKKLEKAYAEYIKNPTVGLSPDVRSQTATIAGGVGKPGMYPVYSGMRLCDLYATAGGSAKRMVDGTEMEIADLPLSVLVRDGKIIEVDFAAAIERGDKLNNIRLRRGDYIFVAVRTESMVSLIGEVAKPLRRVHNNSLTVMELIATAGGLKETHWRYGVIIRGGLASPTTYRIDIDGILKGTKKNVRLHAGDIVYIPRDNSTEYNVFVRKIMPTAQLVNLITTPLSWYLRPSD